MRRSRPFKPYGFLNVFFPPRTRTHLHPLPWVYRTYVTYKRIRALIHSHTQRKIGEHQVSLPTTSNYLIKTKQKQLWLNFKRHKQCVCAHVDVLVYSLSLSFSLTVRTYQRQPSPTIDHRGYQIHIKTNETKQLKNVCVPELW